MKIHLFHDWVDEYGFSCIWWNAKTDEITYLFNYRKCNICGKIQQRNAFGRWITQ